MVKGHQERLDDLVEEVMAEAEAAYVSVGRIGVTVGPGSFTGLRAGLAFAKGLGAALGIPLAGVGTLPALAGSARSDAMTAAVIDARRGQIYTQFFKGM